MDSTKAQTKAEKQRELQRFLVEAEAYRRQVDELSRQMQLLETRIIEINSTIGSFDSLKESKKGSEIMVPLGSDCLIRAELKETEKVIVGVGAGVSVEETTSKAKEILRLREEKMEETLKKLQNALLEANNRLLELESASNKLMREIQT